MTDILRITLGRYGVFRHW